MDLKWLVGRCLFRNVQVVELAHWEVEIIEILEVQPHPNPNK